MMHPLHSSTAGRRQLFGLGWPFSDSQSQQQQQQQLSGNAIHFKDERLLPFSAEQLYDVVADVDKYKEFLPWCTHSRVLFRTPTYMDAELGITFKMLPSQIYMSRVTFDRPRLIKVVVPDESALFNHLTNQWTFQDESKDGKKCSRTTFEITFEFRSQLHRMMADTYFTEVAQNMISVFHDRCAQVYEKKR